MLPPSGSTRPILLLQCSLSLRTSRTLRTPRQRTSNPPTLGVIFWLEHREGDLRNPPPQAQHTHLALGLVEDAVHGIEQSHAPVQLEHLLLGQLRAEQTDTGQLGPERRQTRSPGMGDTVGEGEGLSRGDPRWG